MTETSASVLFVCMGNICRSPMAEGIARVALRGAGLAVHTDSAGTHDYHPGKPPDSRARQVAAELGWPIDDLRARQVAQADFARFDLILAADADNLARLQARQPAGSTAELALLLPWCGHPDTEEVPDPYYGDLEGFHHTARLLLDAMPGFLRRLRGQA